MIRNNSLVLSPCARAHGWLSPCRASERAITDFSFFPRIRVITYNLVWSVYNISIKRTHVPVASSVLVDSPIAALRAKKWPLATSHFGQSSTSDARNDKRRTCVSAWILGWFMCKAVAYIQGVSVAASVYSLVAVSLDRYVPLVRFYSRAKRRTTHTGARPCRCGAWSTRKRRLSFCPRAFFRYACANSNAIYNDLLLAEHWLHSKRNEVPLKFHR